MNVLRHHVIREYEPVLPEKPSSDPPSGLNRLRTESQPDWLVAVFGLGRPVSWSRRQLRSMGEVVEGAFTRAEKPLILDKTVFRLRTEGRKASHVKMLQLGLRGDDYLNPDLILPGDWVMAWCFNNGQDKARVKAALLDGKPANGFMDGLKFLGRVHGVRRNGSVDPSTGTKRSAYGVTAIGFSELDTQFYYDLALASAAAVSGDAVKWMAQVGLDFNDLLRGGLERAADLKDNAGILLAAMVDIVLGRGIRSDVNDAARSATAAAGADDLTQHDLVPAPQAGKEAPAAYLVPRGVGLALGKTVSQASKDDRVFGYADIMDTVIGCQSYEPGSGFQPVLDASASRGPRKFCRDPLKGTFLPVNLSFVNHPVWSILTSYLNPQVNEIYTAMRCDESGSVVPTLVARQLPFSTDVAKAGPDFPLTRLLSRPRWVIAPQMVRQEDVGRSDATRCNLVHVYGAALSFAKNKSETVQMSRNPPLFDQLDIQRSGIRARMGSVTCALSDVDNADAQRAWLSMIADTAFGSHLTFNGTLNTAGIQSPVAEGDVVEHDGVAYEVESVTHECSVNDGKKKFETVLGLSSGMPVDQSGATDDIPVYPGFANTAVNRSHPEDVPAFQSIGVDIADLTEDVRGSGRSSVGDRTDAGGVDDFAGQSEPGLGGTPFRR